MSNPYIKRVLIQCPNDITARLAVPADFIETVTGQTFLKLFLPDRSSYTESKNYPSSAPTISRSFISAIASIKPYERSIEFKINDQRQCFFDAIKDISRRQTSSTYTLKTPINLIDYVLPEDNDRALAIANATPYEPFTVRTGYIEEPKAGGGTVGLDELGSYIQNGFTFKFTEIGLRYE